MCGANEATDGNDDATVKVLQSICMYVTKKTLNGIVAVNSPFQTLVVDFSSNLYNSSNNCAFQKHFPNK